MIALVQKCETQKKWNCWKDLSYKSDQNHNKEAGCFFLEANKGKFSAEFSVNLAERLHCWVLTPNADKEKKLLICSWHGPWTKVRKEDDRQKILKQMLLNLEALKSEMECIAVLVGGDFNLSSAKAKEVLGRNNKPADTDLCHKYKPNRKNLIDFIIVWPKKRFKCTRTENVLEMSGENPLFDHPVVRYDFNFILKEKETKGGKE